MEFRFAGVACLALTSLFTAACSTATNATPDPTLDPSQPHYGKTDDDWATAWNQWLFKVTDCSKEPIKDTTGQSCAINQDPVSPVFFLTGTYGGTVVRD